MFGYIFYFINQFFGVKFISHAWWFFFKYFGRVEEILNIMRLTKFSKHRYIFLLE